MKTLKTIVGCALTAALCVFSLAAQAAEKSVKWSLPGDWESGGECAGMVRGLGEVGAPDLPAFRYTVTMPKGAKLTGVTFDAAWKEVEGVPSPVAMPVTSGQKLVYPEPGPQFNEVYPASAAYALEAMISGNKILQPIVITPYKWDGPTKTLYRATKLDVTITYTEPRTLKLTTSSVDETEGEVLILSPHDFVSLWQGYAAFRKSTDAGKNFTFTVKDTKEIYDYPGLTDREKTDYALALHHYIETNFYKAASCDKQYVILGAAPKKGSVAFNPDTMIPTREFLNKNPLNEWVQTGDMYYGCMDRLNNGQIDPNVEVWDYQNDGVYMGAGTSGSYTTDPNNCVDWTMEIAVTRVPLLERSVEKLGSSTIEKTAAQMMDAFTNRLAWAESAAFETADRGRAFLGGDENENISRGDRGDYSLEHTFFDGILNMFDAKHCNPSGSSEWGPRSRVYNITSKIQPSRDAKIIAMNISNATKAEAYAASGDMMNFYCHGMPREYGLISAPLAYQGGGFYSVYASCFSCHAGKYGFDDGGAGITNALCFGEAPIVAPNAHWGALVTATSTGMGWSGGFDSISLAMDRHLLNALYGNGVNNGVPMNAGQACKYMHNNCGLTGAGAAQGGCNAKVVVHGDPLIKVFMMPNRTALTGYSQKLSVSTASSKSFTIDTDVAAARAAFSDAGNQTLTLQGAGKFRTTDTLTVTNVANLVWNVAGGAGRNGITFSGTKGNLTLGGTATRYFGPKLTNVGNIAVTGGNVTLDFDTTACGFDELDFVSQDDNKANPNILRTRKEGFIPAAQTIPVVNSALKLQTINIGGSNATLKDTPLFYVTNGVLTVESNPYWGTEYFVRPTYLSDAKLLGEYVDFGLGRPDSNGYDIYVDGTSEIGGSTPIKVTGELRLHLEDAATTLMITNALANGHNGAVGSVALTGSGTVKIVTPQTFTGGITVGSGVKLVLGIANAVVGDITVQDGGKLELQAAPLVGAVNLKLLGSAALVLPHVGASGVYQVVDSSLGTITADANAKVYDANSPSSALTGSFSNGYYLPTSAVLTWGSSGGSWDTTTTNWKTAGGASTAFADGKAVKFDATGYTMVSSSSAVQPSSMEVSGNSYTFSVSSMSGLINPSAATFASSAKFYVPLHVDGALKITGGNTEFEQSFGEMTAQLVEVGSGASLRLGAGKTLRSADRKVRALRFTFTATKENNNRAAVQELRLFNRSGRFKFPVDTIIRDSNNEEIRITGESGEGHTYTWIKSNHSKEDESLKALIDGSLGNNNKWWPDKQSMPVSFEIVFPSDQSMVTGYNLCMADHKPRNPKSWTVESSTDGTIFAQEASESDHEYDIAKDWVNGDGSAKAFDLMRPDGRVVIKTGGALLARGNMASNLAFEDGAVLKVIQTSKLSCTDTMTGLTLPASGTVIVNTDDATQQTTPFEILSGYNLADSDIAKFKTASATAALSIQDGNLYVVTGGVKQPPYTAELSNPGATVTWANLGWRDGSSAAFNWNDSVIYVPSGTATVQVVSLATGGTTIDLGTALSISVVKFTGGSTETLTLSWSAACAPAKIDLSEYNGRVVLSPGSHLTSTTEIVANCDTVLPASCTAKLTINDGQKATVMNGSYAGTLTFSGNGELCFGGAMPSTLPYTTGNPSGNGIVGYAGTFSSSGTLEFKNSLTERRIEVGAEIKASKVHFGNANDSIETINQTGGLVEATHNGAGTDTGSSALIIAHWGYGHPSIITYNLLGGSMVSTNATQYGVYFGADGRAIMTIGGGDTHALLDTTGIAQGNQERTQASSLTIAANGELRLGTGGLYFRNDNATVTLSGGTIHARENASIQLDNANGLQLAGNTTSTISAAAGKTITVVSKFSGLGTLNVGGAGTVSLTNTTGFPDTVTVASGATLALPPGYKLKDGKIVEDIEIQYGPLMSERWHQHNPFNWFAAYVGGDLTPCGCVAMGVGQMFHYYRWPVRTDTVTEAATTYQTGGEVTAFPLAVDGKNPFLWDEMRDYASACTLTGQYEAARMILWCDALAKMCFQPGGSNTALYYVPESVSYWYEKGEELLPSAGDHRERLKTELAAGRPIQTTIDGHQVVIDGWRSSDNKFHVNWGQEDYDSSKTTWYDVTQSTLGSWSVSSFWVGITPRKMAQIQTLPKLGSSTVTLAWDVPAVHTNAITGFTVKDYTCADAVTNYTISGTNELSYTRADYYPIPGVYGATENATFSCTVHSSNTKALIVDVQVRYDGGPWQTFATPTLSTEESYEDPKTGEWIDRTIAVDIHLDLSSHAGEAAEFRIKTTRTGNSFAAEHTGPYLRLYKCAWTNVYAPVAAVEHAVGATARSLEISGLAAGSYHSFTVTPTIEGAVESEPMGMRVTAASQEIPALPEILRVETMGSPITDGFVREVKPGAMVFFVKGSETVTGVRAAISHPGLVAANLVRVKSIPQGNWYAIEIDASEQITVNSRMILTIEATDAYENRAVKDLMLIVSNTIEDDNDGQLMSALDQENAVIVPPDVTNHLESTFDQPLVGAGTVVFNNMLPEGTALISSLQNSFAWHGTVRMVDCPKVEYPQMYKNENSFLVEEKSPTPPPGPVAPEILQSAYLWLDASDASTIIKDNDNYVTNWVSRSSSGNYAEAYTGSNVTHGPTVSAGALTDKDVVDFGNSGSGMDLQFQRSQSVCAVFMVVDMADNGNAFILGDNSEYHFHRGSGSSNVPYFAGHASDYLENGVIRRNGEAKTKNDAIGTGYGLITLVPQQGVTASRFCQDRGGGDHRDGGKKVAELVILTSRPTDDDRAAVESYLMRKWLATHKATVSGNTNWSQIEWTPAITDPSTAVLDLTVQNDAVITLDNSATYKALCVSGDATLKYAPTLSDNDYYAAFPGGKAVVPVAKIAHAVIPAAGTTISYEAAASTKAGYTTSVDANGFYIQADGTMRVGSVNVSFPGGNGNNNVPANRLSDNASYSGIDHGAYPVVGAKWNDVPAVNNSSGVAVNAIMADGTTKASTSINVALSNVANPYDMSGRNVPDRLLYGYCDDGSGPTATVTGIPYSRYRVVVYFSCDTAGGRNFGYAVVKDGDSAAVNYCGSATGTTGGNTIKGTSAWGFSLDAPAVAESVNYLVSDVMISSTATIGTNKGSNRAGFAGFQIIDCTGEDRSVAYCATATADCTWSELWRGALPPAGADVKIINGGSEGVTTVTIPSGTSVGRMTIESPADKELKFAGFANLTATALDFSNAPGGVGIDATAGLTVTDPLKSYIRDTNVKVVFHGSGENGATLTYNLNEKKTVQGHWVFEGGKHALTYGNSVSYAPAFGANATEDNPTVLVKSGTVLDFTGKDISYWNGSVDINGIIAVENGGRINMKDNGGTVYYRQRLTLNPGAEFYVNMAADNFRLQGGTATEATAQLYVPAGDGTAYIKPTDATRDSIRLHHDSTIGLGITVGAGSTLDIQTKITSENNDNNYEIAKYAAGTLKLSGDISDFYPHGYSKNVKFSVHAGTLDLAMATEVRCGLWAASGATVELTGSGTTVSGVISGAGSVVRNGSGNVTLSGANTYTGTTTVSAGTLVVAEGAQLGTGNYSVAEGATLNLGTHRPTTAKLVANSQGTIIIKLQDTAEEETAFNAGQQVKLIDVEGSPFAGSITIIDATGAERDLKSVEIVDGKIAVTKSDDAKVPPFNLTDPTGTAVWTAEGWLDSSDTPQAVVAADWNNQVSANIALASGAATRTLDRSIHLSTLNITNAGTLVLADAGDYTLTAATIDDSVSTGATTLDFAPGAANITAGRNTIIRKGGTGTLTVGSGHKATLADATFGAYEAADGSFFRWDNAETTSYTQASHTPIASTVATNAFNNATVTYDTGAYLLRVEDGDNVTLKKSGSYIDARIVMTGGNLALGGGEAMFLGKTAGTLLGMTGGTATFLKDSGDSTEYADNLAIGWSSGVAYVVDVAGGVLSVPNARILPWEGAQIRVADGGTIRAKGVYRRDGGNSAASLAINAGGTVEVGAYGLVSDGNNKLTVTLDGGVLANSVANTVNVKGGITVSSASVISNDYAMTMTSPLKGSGAITKKGTETLTLSDLANYTGTITISAGTVDIGTKRGLTVGGAGSVKAKLTEAYHPNDVVTLFTAASGATTNLAELKDMDGNVISDTLYTFKDGVVTFNPPVATDGTIFYFTLNEALDAVPADGTVMLCTNVAMVAAYTLNKSITLDGGIYEITGSGFTGSGTLTIAGGYIGVTDLPSNYSIIGGKYKGKGTWQVAAGYRYVDLAKLTAYEDYAKQVIAGAEGKTDEKVFPVSTEGTTTTYEGELAFTKEELVEKGVIASASATDAEVTTALNTAQANELLGWQNAILGLDGTETAYKDIPVPVPVQTDEPGKLTIKLGSNVTVDTKAGATVRYKVKITSAQGESETEYQSYDQPFELDLPESGVAYYKFDVIVTPAK